LAPAFAIGFGAASNDLYKVLRVRRGKESRVNNFD
jgi:hypothetical protein